MEKNKDVTINEKKFQICLPSARDGSWIISLITGRIFHLPEHYSRVQDIIFERCNAYINTPDGAGAIPVKIYAKGKWLVPDLDLEQDIDTVNQLCEEALDFAVGPTLRRLMKEAEAAEAAKSKNINP